MILSWIHGNIRTASYRLQLAGSVPAEPRRSSGFVCRCGMLALPCPQLCGAQMCPGHPEQRPRWGMWHGRVAVLPLGCCVAFRLCASQIGISPSQCSSAGSNLSQQQELCKLHFFQWHRIPSLLTVWKWNRVSAEVCGLVPVQFSALLLSNISKRKLLRLQEAIAGQNWKLEKA